MRLSHLRQCTSEIMAANMHITFLLIVLFSDIYLTHTRACDLVPSNVGTDGTCFDLRAEPYITYETSQFGADIEGASVNPEGDMFAVNFGTTETKHQLGQITPQQKLFYIDDNHASFFNGIRFFNSQTAFVADKNHRVLQINVDPGNVVSSSRTYCGNETMVEPNDLTISKSGTIYTSGQNWISDTDSTDGDIWSCLPDGTIQRLELLGRTNGIELSPDEQHLYVSESFNTGGVAIVQRIWKYNANVVQGTINSKTLFADFAKIDNTPGFDVDGMKTDILGNLFVSRYSGQILNIFKSTYKRYRFIKIFSIILGQHVAIFSPQGALIGKISVSFPNPTNCEFGGPNGTTLYIVGQCAQTGRGCVDRIEVVTPGRSWTNLQTSNAHRSTLHSAWSYLLVLVLCFSYLKLIV